VENSGAQLHELTIERLAPGKTVADFRQWVAGGMRGMPPVEPVGGFAGLDTGKHGWVTITLTPGNYLLNCYVPTPKMGSRTLCMGWWSRSLSTKNDGKGR